MTVDVNGGIHAADTGRFTGHTQIEGDPAEAIDTPRWTGDPFVIVQGGLVDNNCALPVVDLDFMDADSYTAEDFADDVLGPDGAIARLDALGAPGWRDQVIEWAQRNAERYDDGFHDLSDKVAAAAAQISTDTEPTPGQHPYVIISGGLVANDPALPCFDLDFMGDVFETREEFERHVFGEDGMIRRLHEAGATTYRDDVIRWTQQRIDDWEACDAVPLRARLGAELNAMWLA